MSHPIKVLIVGTGGDVLKSMEFSQLMKSLYPLEVQIESITAMDARQMRLEPNDDIIKVPNIIPDMYQYYPHSEIPKPRRDRRADERKSKKRKK